MNKEKLGAKITEDITLCMEKTLDFVHVACPETHYKQLRSKILRLNNDTIRSLMLWIDKEDN